MEDKIPQNILSVQPLSQTPVSPLNNLPKILLLILLGLTVIAGSIFVGFKIGKNQITNQQPTTQPTASSPTTTEPLVPTNSISPTTQPLTNGWVKYTHPVAEYSLDYPSSWRVELQETSKDIKQDYHDFIIISPDYKTSGEIYSLLENGAEIFIRAEKANKSTIDDSFNSDSLALEIARNKIYTNVDGQQAIQFDWSYEGQEATTTEFIKNGTLYTIKLTYVGDSGKQAMWNNYLKLLTSFKAK